MGPEEIEKVTQFTVQRSELLFCCCCCCFFSCCFTCHSSSWQTLSSVIKSSLSAVLLDNQMGFSSTRQWVSVKHVPSRSCCLEKHSLWKVHRYQTKLLISTTEGGYTNRVKPAFNIHTERRFNESFYDLIVSFKKKNHFWFRFLLGYFQESTMRETINNHHIFISICRKSMCNLWYRWHQSDDSSNSQLQNLPPDQPLNWCLLKDKGMIGVFICCVSVSLYGYIYSLCKFEHPTCLFRFFKIISNDSFTKL